MYCPYCGNKLETNDGILYCKTARCYFSKHMQNCFEEIIYNPAGINVNNFKDESSNYGRFYCVNCGNRMYKAETLQEACSCCGFEINKSMYYEIIELNPHCSF